MEERQLYQLSRLYHNCQETLDNTGDEALTILVTAQREEFADQYWTLAGNEPQPDPPLDRRSPPPTPALPPPF